VFRENLTAHHFNAFCFYSAILIEEVRFFMKARRLLIENRSVVLLTFSMLVMILSFGGGCPRNTSLSRREQITEIPHFPWPPPQASATYIIPNTLIISKSGVTRLRDVDERITVALSDHGYSERSYFAVPAGYAQVTRIEQIEIDGTSMKGDNRWVQDASPLSVFSLQAYLKALFLAPRGYFRVIVFIITPIPFSQSDTKITREEAMKWLSSGLNRLPDSIGEMEFSSQTFTCSALVYEFERPTESHDPTIRIPGRLQGLVHLERAGLMEGLRK